MMRHFIGVEVRQDRYGIVIHKQKYDMEISQVFSMENCNKVCNPIALRRKLFEIENGKGTNTKEYKQIVWCLVYLRATRPKLCYNVWLIYKYMEKPTEMHTVAAKRVLRYLHGTSSYGVEYEKNREIWLIRWPDYVYTSVHDDRKRTYDYVLMTGYVPYLGLPKS